MYNLTINLQQLYLKIKIKHCFDIIHTKNRSMCILLFCFLNLVFTDEDFGNKIESFKTMEKCFYSPLYHYSLLHNM